MPHKGIGWLLSEENISSKEVPFWAQFGGGITFQGQSK